MREARSITITKRMARVSGIVGLAVLLTLTTLLPASVHATKYGAGSYGRCQYETCAISLSSSSSVAVNVTPASGTTKCSITADNVTVTTSSSTGYNLTLIDGDTVTSMASGGNLVLASSTTYASPGVLVANRWGYRVDSAGTFGAGPTSTLSNGSIPSLTFAGIKSSSSSADTIVNSSSAAVGGVTTKVWYGMCASAVLPSGTYSDSVLYTALVN